MWCVRYLVKCRLNSDENDRLAEDIKSGTLARGKIFYEGTALREATIDENNIVQFIEICYCLKGGLYPIAMEIPVLNQYFEILEVKDARFRDQCTMECEFCDCTRSIKLPGKRLMNELDITQEGNCNAEFKDIGRIKLNRKKQKEGIKALKILHDNYNNDRNVKPLFAGDAISGLFAIFYDGIDHFRVKHIPDNNEFRLMLRDLGLELYNSVDSIKSTARSSLAGSDTRSNVV